MTYYYELETRDGSIDYELEPTWDEIKNAIISIISKKTPQEIYNILSEVAEGDEELEEYFYEELKEHFQESAYERYKDAKQTREDYIYDYYHDKL